MKKFVCALAVAFLAVSLANPADMPFGSVKDTVNDVVDGIKTLCGVISCGEGNPVFTYKCCGQRGDMCCPDPTTLGYILIVAAILIVIALVTCCCCCCCTCCRRRRQNTVIVVNTGADGMPILKSME